MQKKIFRFVSGKQVIFGVLHAIFCLLIQRFQPYIRCNVKITLAIKEICRVPAVTQSPELNLSTTYKFGMAYRT